MKSTMVMIAVADLMLCIAAQAMLVNEDERNEREAQYAQQEAAIKTEREALTDDQERVAAEIKKQEGEARRDLAKIRSATELTQAENRRLRTKRWEIVTSRYFLHQKDFDPTGSKKEIGRLYCMQNGLFTGPNTQAMSDEQVLTWASGLTAEVEEVVLFVENGGNDEYLHGLSLLKKVDRIKFYTFSPLPSDTEFRITTPP